MKFRLIAKYILEYDTGIPVIVFWGVAIFVSGVIFVLFQTRINYRMFVRQSSFFLFMGYVFIVLCTTVLFRVECDEMKYMIRPFGSYTGLNNKMLAQNLMNIMMFIPVGFFSGGALKKKHIKNAFEIGLVFSLSIEVAQLILRRGVCNIDDVIHNTLGCVIGFVGFVLFYKMIRRIA